MYKVVGTDNFNRDNRSDTVIVGMISKEEADKITKEHNENMHQSDPIWYVTMKQDAPIFEVDY